MRIRVVAPSRWIDGATSERFLSFVAKHEKRMRFEFHPQCFQRAGQLAGADQLRADALLEALCDKSVDAIMLARGGYGAGRLLPYLNKTYSDGPVVMGYSDTLSILLRLSDLGLRCIHGPMAIDVTDPEKTTSLATAIERLYAKAFPSPDISDDRLETVRAGDAQGPIIAANLSVLTRLIGTKYFPPINDSVLVIEDVDEYFYAIDRMFLHLKQAGILQAISGLVLGGFTKMHDNEVAWGESVEEIAKRYTEDRKIPVVSRYPMGHGACNVCIPQFAFGTLQAKGGGAFLHWRGMGE